MACRSRLARRRWPGDDGRAARRGARIGTAIAVGRVPATGHERTPLAACSPVDRSRATSTTPRRGPSRVATSPSTRPSHPSRGSSTTGRSTSTTASFRLSPGCRSARSRTPSTAASCWPACSAGSRSAVLPRPACCSVPWSARHRRAARPWAWTTGVFAAAVGLSTPLLWLASRALVYHEAELWGAALAILGFERVVAVVVDPARRGPGVGVRRRRPRPRHAWLVGVGAGARARRARRGPAVAAGVARRGDDRPRRGRAVLLYAAVNTARFETPFSVPFDAQVLNAFSAPRRAALEDNDGTLFGLKFIPTAALQYLRPDTVAPRALFPGLVGRAGRRRRRRHVRHRRSLGLTARRRTGVRAGVDHRRRGRRASSAGGLLGHRPARRRGGRRPDAGDHVHRPALPRRLRARPRRRGERRRARRRGVDRRVGAVDARWSLAVGGTLLVIGLTVNAGLALLARNVYLLPTDRGAARVRRRSVPTARRSRWGNAAERRRARRAGRAGGGRHRRHPRRLRRPLSAARGRSGCRSSCGPAARGASSSRATPSGRSSAGTAGRSCSNATRDGRRLVFEGTRPHRGPADRRHRPDHCRRPRCCRSRPTVQADVDGGARRSTCSPNRRADR